MATTHAARISALETIVTATAEAQARQGETLDRILAHLEADRPAKTERVTAPAPEPAEVTKTLTRSAWKSLRTTKAGKVRKAFAGLTREQAFEAGLCPGFRLPTGDMRRSLSA